MRYLLVFYALLVVVLQIILANCWLYLLPTHLMNSQRPGSHNIKESLCRLNMGRKNKPPSIGNYPRKIKRLLHSIKVNSSRSFEELYTPRYEHFLKFEASDNMYQVLMQKINKTASWMNVTLKQDFGLRQPKVLPTVFEYISQNPLQQNFAEYIKSAQLVDLFNSPNVTALIPTDEAIKASLDSINNDFAQNISKLQLFIRSFLFPVRLRRKALVELKSTPPMDANGVACEIRVVRDDVTVNGNKLTNSSDSRCRNGVVHTIEEFQLPNIKI